MRVFIFLFCFVFFSSCKNYKNEEEKIEISDNQKYVNNLIERCIEKGDSRAFGELVTYYGKNHSGRYEILPIAIIMADKYNNDNARVTIYFQMIMIRNEGKRNKELFFSLNQNQQDFVASYLIEGVKNKNPGCKALLKKALIGGYKLKNDDKQFENLVME
jgi:F0F1-type ATP synthase delta subunit